MILVIGHGRADEVQPNIEWLATRTQLRHVDAVEQALPLLKTLPEPCEAIVLIQSRPGQYSENQLLQLQQAAPLSRMLALLGSWCEGEMRTGRPWPGLRRLYWYEFRPRLARELFGPHGGSASWNLPATASEADHLLEDMSPGQHLPRPEGLVIIRAARFIDFEAYAAALASAGLPGVWWRDGQPPQARGMVAMLWDVDLYSPATLHEVRYAAQHCRAAPLICVVGFLRTSQRDALRASGAAECLAKPFVIADLLQVLCDSLPKSGAESD